MALVKCKDCGNENSKSATVCPKCGAKIVRTSGCTMVVAVVFGLAVFMSVVSNCSQSGRRDSSASRPSAASSASVPATAQEPAPHDDLSLFISKFGAPDRIESSENETPRPPIVTKQLIYDKENVRAVYVVDGNIGAAPPYEKWKLLGFQDNRTNAVLQPQEVVTRLEKRRK